MATKTALRLPQEQLSDHERTKKWTLPSNGRSRRMNSSDFGSHPSQAREMGSTLRRFRHIYLISLKLRRTVPQLRYLCPNSFDQVTTVNYLFRILA
jgi:hypothetical protein